MSGKAFACAVATTLRERHRPLSISIIADSAIVRFVLERHSPFPAQRSFHLQDLLPPSCLNISISTVDNPCLNALSRPQRSRLLITASTCSLIRLRILIPFVYNLFIMRSFDFSASALSILALASSASAFWRMPCPGRVATERLDPIVAPGGVSGHVHTISGSNVSLQSRLALKNQV